ncbi:c-5 sterol desaturase [Bonamia ostreae]|uniref:C-5 sterol desaturase n=1 Tax=Bonamia ostreae TaxID=126728 RepID=A0ABV2AKP5_9EUKA
MSPFASHAFHPVDGWLQVLNLTSKSLPYHIFVYLFPLHKRLYVSLFVFVNCWTISIHDMIYFNRLTLINGAANHSLHHAKFNYNYGQYFIVFDWLFGTFKAPPKEEMDGTYLKRKID